jgi:hypothetical protein
MADGHVLRTADRGDTWDDTGMRTGPILAMAAAG